MKPAALKAMSQSPREWWIFKDALTERHRVVNELGYPRHEAFQVIPKADYETLLARAEKLVEALDELATKLVPKIPKMDGTDSWSPYQKFIDETVKTALAKWREDGEE